MSEHPMTEAVVAMIDARGLHDALVWWMRVAHNWPTEEAVTYCLNAIDAMAQGDEDHVIYDLDGDALARAFQWVNIFGLEPFVEACRAATA